MAGGSRWRDGVSWTLKNRIRWWLSESCKQNPVDVTFSLPYSPNKLKTTDEYRIHARCHTLRCSRKGVDVERGPGGVVVAALFSSELQPGSATAHARRGLACPPHSHTHLGEKRDGTKRARMGADWLFDMDGRPPETSLLEDAVTYAAKNVDMSEWLRRQTRNLLGFACAGSNPAVDDFFVLFFPIFWFHGRRSISCSRHILFCTSTTAAEERCVLGLGNRLPAVLDESRAAVLHTFPLRLQISIKSNY